MDDLLQMNSDLIPNSLRKRAEKQPWSYLLLSGNPVLTYGVLSLEEWDSAVMWGPAGKLYSGRLILSDWLPWHMPRRPGEHTPGHVCEGVPMGNSVWGNNLPWTWTATSIGWRLSWNESRGLSQPVEPALNRASVAVFTAWEHQMPAASALDMDSVPAANQGASRSLPLGWDASLAPIFLSSADSWIE